MYVLLHFNIIFVFYRVKYVLVYTVPNWNLRIKMIHSIVHLQKYLNPTRFRLRHSRINPRLWFGLLFHEQTILKITALYTWLPRLRTVTFLTTCAENTNLEDGSICIYQYSCLLNALFDMLYYVTDTPNHNQQVRLHHTRAICITQPPSSGKQAISQISVIPF